MILFSIITVSYNEAKNIAKTIESVLGQSYKDYEYVIVDGASKDGTYEIEKKILSAVDNGRIKISSEPDTGIYNAMNKGIYMAEGEWLIFLNAGDTFVNDKVLEKISSEIWKIENKEHMDIYYGEVIYRYNNLYKHLKALDLVEIYKKMPFCHQGAIINRKIMNKYLYNESYQIAADYDFFLTVYLQKAKFQKLDMIIAKFAVGGISTSGNTEQIFEYLTIQYKNNLIDKKTYYKNVTKCKKSGKRKAFIKKIVPISILEIYREFRLKKDGFKKEKIKLY